MGFSLVAESGGCPCLRWGLCSGAQALGPMGSVAVAPGLKSTGSVLVGCGLSPSGMWDLQGFEPMSPALAGEFFTPESSGKPLIV